MIGVLSNKLNEKFTEKLGIPCFYINEFDPQHPINVDGLFIDWVSKVSDNEVAWMRQASLLQTYIKSGMPIVIFDREMSLTEKEVNWCKKFNVYLFEPYLNSGRNGFAYLPEWANESKILFNYKKKYDVVHLSYIVEREIKEFEKWIRDYARIFPDKKVAYYSTFISDFKMEDFAKDNLVYAKCDSNVYQNGNVMIAFDTEKSYRMGYLNPNIFDAMNYACMPLLPIDHKYFHGLFKGIVIENLKEMDYFVSSMAKVKNVVIEEIFDRIKQEWNEFTIEHAIDVVKHCFDK